MKGPGSPCSGSFRRTCGKAFKKSKVKWQKSKVTPCALVPAVEVNASGPKHCEERDFKDRGLRLNGLYKTNPTSIYAIYAASRGATGSNSPPQGDPVVMGALTIASRAFNSRSSTS